MKKVIKAIVFTMVTLSFVGFYSIPSSWAVTDEEFQTLQKQVKDQNQLLQQLLKQNQADQQEIQTLKQQQGQTEQKADQIKQTADQAAQTAQAAQAEASAKVQPVAAALNVPQENHNFLLTGDAEFQYTDQGGGNKARGSYGLADFAPIFLYRANDKVLFEAGFDTTLSNSSFDTTKDTNPGALSSGNSGYSTTFNLSFATIDYLFNDYATLVAGKMLLPLGTYSERSAGWLNKLPDDPLSRGLLPSSGVGAQVRGSKAIGNNGAMVTYAVYTANGMHSVDGTSYATTIDSSGNTVLNLDTDGNVSNMNRTPSEGGRIGWFYPWKPHYDVELGLSGQSGEWNTDGKMWQAGVLDAAVHLSPYFETKGEYIYTRQRTTDLGRITPQGWWLQSGFKMSFFNLDVPIIPNTELVFRYDTTNYDVGSLSTPKASRRFEPGIVYYITNTLWLEGAYEKTFYSGGSPADNEWILQLSYGF